MLNNVYPSLLAEEQVDSLWGKDPFVVNVPGSLVLCGHKDFCALLGV